MAEFIDYLTVRGDRWDAIANEFYADPYGYERIIRENPTYMNTATLPGGVTLRIPVIDEQPVLISDESLPPWRR